MQINYLNSINSNSVYITKKTSYSSLLFKSDEELSSILCPPATLDAWTFTGKEIREALEGKRILCPSIDLSNLCNLNCPYCYIESPTSIKKTRYDNELSLPELKVLIESLAENGTKTINIIGAGEPTIDPNFIEIIKFINSFRIKVLVATNGIQISKSDELLQTLCKVKASIVIKMNSFDTKLQDLLVNYKGYSSLRDQAIELLIDNGFTSQKPTRLAYNTLIMQANYNEIPQIFKYCRQNNICHICGDYMPTGRTYNGLFQGYGLLESTNNLNIKKLYQPISNKQRNNLIQLIMNNKKEKFPLLSNWAYISGIPCVQALGIQIDNQGDIWPCPARKQIIDGKLLSIKIGNIRATKSILNLWKSNKYLREFRQSYNGSCPYKYITLI